MADSDSAASTRDASWQQTWGDREFIERWSTKGNWQAPIREAQTAMVLRMIPHPVNQPIRADSNSRYRCRLRRACRGGFA